MALLERMLLVTDEICEVTGMSRSKVYEAYKSGALRYRIIGGRRRVTPADLRAFLGVDA